MLRTKFYLTGCSHVKHYKYENNVPTTLGWTIAMGLICSLSSNFPYKFNFIINFDLVVMCEVNHIV